MIKVDAALKRVVDKDSLGGRDLTPIELEMIDRLAKGNDTTFVKNTLAQNIDTDLDFLINVLQNVKRYKDTHIFRVVPEHVDRAFKLFGVQLSEEGRKVKAEINMLGKYDLIPANYSQCPMCGRHLEPGLFLISDAPQYAGVGHLPFCMDCVARIGVLSYNECKEDLKEAIILCCYKLDIVVVKELIDDVVDKCIKDPTIGVTGKYILDYIKRQSFNYNRELSAKSPRDQRFFRTNFGGAPFKKTFDKVGVQLYDEIKEHKPATSKTNDISPEDAEALETEQGRREFTRLQLKWGVDDIDQLRWLEANYDDWYEKNNISGGKGDEMIVKQLCFEEYAIMQARNVDGKDAKQLDKNIKNLIALMKESNLTPKQQAKNDDLTVKNLGSWIKEIEKHKPIVLRDPGLQDPDNITKFRDSYAGALARTLGKPNDYTKKFQENMKEHTISFDSFLDEESKD
jgi:hypothetical protein